MINVVYSGNYAVFDGIFLSALSMAQKSSDSLSIQILTADYRELNPKYIPIEEEDRFLLERSIKEYNKENSVQLIDVKPQADKRLAGKKNFANSYTPYALLRLLVDEIDEIPDRFIYMDADTVVMQDIASLWNEDLEGKTIGGVRDYLGRFFIGPNYMNTGVLLIDMKKARENDLFTRARILLYSKKMPFPDQDALNKALKGEKKFLSRRYNAMKHLNGKTVIRHYAKMILWRPFKIINVKPWNVDEFHKSWKIYDHDPLIFEMNRLKKAYGRSK